MKRIFPWLIGFMIFGVRATCRLRIHNDSRERIRQQTGRTYVFAQLHAHQIAASMFGEAGTGAMVSRSADGEMIVPTLRLCGKTAVRGSSGKTRKGGASALVALIQHVNDGWPAVIAVDGPRGPRGYAQKGAGFLAQKTSTPILPVLVIPSRRWIISRTWDRMQIPIPFSTVHVHFGDPIFVNEGDDLDAVADQLGRTLRSMEARIDPAEQPTEIQSDQVDAAQEIRLTSPTNIAA